MKRLYSAFSYRNSIILVFSIFILFFFIISGLPSSSNPMISTTSVEASAEPPATVTPVATSSIRRSLAATPFFVPTITATKVDSIFTDVDSDGKADPGDTLMYTVTITNSGTDATGVNFNDTIDSNTTLVPGSVVASPIAVNDSYNTIGNVNIQVPAPGVIANDLNPNVVPSTNTAALVVTQVNATAVPGGGSATASTTNGSVTLSSDGSFTYTPNAGVTATTDTFTYTLGNTTGKTDTATVTITLAGRIWFVNSAAASNGDGRLATPFKFLTGAGSADTVDAANDVIFLYSSATSYTGGMTLTANEKLIGQGAGDTLLNITGFTAPSGTNLLPATGGARPIVTAAVNNITLATGNTLRGIRLETSAAAAVALTGSNFTTLFIGEMEIVSTGPALNLATGTLTGPSSVANFSGGLSSSGASATAINLDTIAGAMSSLATGVSNTSGSAIGINIVSSTANFNFANTSVTSTAGTGVNLGGAATGNSGTITFAQLNITPANNQRGLFATSNTGTITATSGTITTNGGTAVEITKTADPDTPLAIALTAVNGTGGTNGILLNNVSGNFSSGATNLQNQTGIGLSVANSAAACDFNGTTVNSSAGTGVSLTSNTGTIMFDDLDSTPDSGQRAFLATENTQQITIISGAMSSTNATTVEITKTTGTTPLQVALTSVAANGGTNGIRLSNTSGSFSVAGTGSAGSGGTITGTGTGVSINTAASVSLSWMNVQSSTDDGINAQNVNGLTLSNCNVTNNGNSTTDEGIELINLTGTSSLTNITCTGNAHNNLFLDNSSGTLASLTVTNGTYSNTGASGNHGFLFQARQTAVVTAVSITGATFENNFSIGMQVIAADTASINNYTVSGCTFRDTGTGNSQEISADFSTSQTGNMTYKFLNNTITGHNSHGFNTFTAAGAGTGGTLNATIDGNTIGTQATIDSGSKIGNGMRININGGATARVKINNNVIRQVPAGRGIEVIARNGSGSANVTVTNNTIVAPTGTTGTGCGPGVLCPLAPIFVQSNDVTIPHSLCSVVSGNTAYDPVSVPGGAGSEFSAYLLESNTSTHTYEGNTALTALQNLTNANPACVTKFVTGAVSVVATGTCTVPPPSAFELPEVLAMARTEENVVSEFEDHFALRTPFGMGNSEGLIQKLQQAELDTMVQAAIERWRLTGISGEMLSRMQALRFEVEDLPDTELAKVKGSLIKIDDLAAGYGWFYDFMPLEDSEFDLGVPGTELQGTHNSAVYGKVDLLTVLMRELGKEVLKDYLKEKKQVPEGLRPLMEMTLAPAVRRLPDASQIGFIIPEKPEIVIPELANETSTKAAAALAATTSTTTAAAVTTQSTSGTLAPQSGETVSLALGTIPAGESVTIMFRATINALGSLPVGTTQVCNQGTVSGSNFSNVLTDDPDVAGANQPTCTALDVADLAVTKTDSPDPVIAGNNITYTITVTNNGPQAAAMASLTDAIPANTTFVSVTTPAGWTRTDSVPVGGTGNITFTNPSVANAASAVFTLVVQVGANTPDATVISNTATVAATTSDTTPANNMATATTTVQRRADLAVTKSDAPDPVIAGNNITYTVNFVNNGPNIADSTTVTDAVPANTTFVSATVTTGTGWSTAAPSVGGTGNIVFSKASVANGETAVFTIVVKVGDTVNNGTIITNSVTAASTTVDGTPGNNTATATTTVSRMADLAVTKSDSPDPAFAGNNITYTIGFTNNGPNIADTVTVTDAVPANTTFVSATVTTGTGWSTSAPSVGGTGNVVFSKASVANAETATFTIVVQINTSTPNGTTITNTATAASTTPDPTPGNNSATATTTANQQADLTITKTDSPDPVFAGNNITYTIGLTNSGPGTASTVTVTDAVPANTTFVSATVTTGSGWSTSAPSVGGTGNVVFSKASVANAETATFTIVVKVTSSVASGTVISNSATAASTTADPTPGDNTASATTTVNTQADVSITKTDSPDPVFAGNNLTYTITVTNNGPSDAQNVTWTDTLPAGTTFVSLSAVGGWTPTTPSVGSGGTVSASNPSFAPGSAVFTLVVKVGSNVASGTVLSNTATVTTTTTDPTPGNDSATATTTVATQVDLALTKSDSPDPVIAGQNITYTIGFTSGGPSDAQTVLITDTVPANTTFVSATVTVGSGWTPATPAVGGTGNVTFSKATTVAGETATFTIVVKVNSSTANGTVITNTAIVTTATTDSSGGNNLATVNTTVQAQADLAVTKSDSPDPAFSGANLTYTIGFTNNGPSDAQSVTVTDAVPANTTFVSATVTTGTGWSTSAPAVGGTGNVVFSKASVTNGETATFTIVVQVNASTPTGTVVTNTVMAATTTTDPTPGNNTATATTTIAQQADLTITKSDSPDPVFAGNNITYTIGLSNGGPGTASTVTVTDAVPANTTFVSATVTIGTGWSTSAPSVGGTGNVVFSKATVANGETATFTIVVQVNSGTASGTIITNSAIAASTTADPVPGDNTAGAMTTVNTQADVSITKTDSPDPVIAGNNLTYTITVANAGPSNASTVNWTDTLPAGTTFVSLSAVGGWTPSTPAVGSGGTVSASNPSFAPGNAVFTLVVKVGSNVASGTVLSNTATVTTTTTDPASGNNSATATTTVQTQADLAVTKSDSPDPVVAGQNITYTIGYTNAGASDAQTVSLTDAVPANTTFVSATVTTGTGWSTAAPTVGGTGNVVFSKATSAAGETATFTIVVKVTASTANGSTITNTVTAASATTDPTPGNNTATAVTTVQAQADLAVTKTDTPDPAFAGGNITYTISFTNNGASDAQTVTVTDAVPANTTFVSATVTTGTGWSTSAPSVGSTGNVVFSKATVAVGETATFTIVVKVNSNTVNGTTITNTAITASATTDPTPGNNSATASTTIQVQADIAITKTDSPDPVVAGQNITYTVTYTQNGPSDASTVAVTDAVPANTTFVSATVTTGTGWSTAAPAVGGTGNVVFSKATSTPGDTATFTIVVKVNANTANGATISNSATATTASVDPTPANNTASATTAVVTQADLAVTKTDSPDPVTAGNNLTYTITFTNNGSSDAQTVTLTDAVPANTTFISASVNTGTGWSTAAPAVGGTGNVVFSKGTVAAGETATFTIVVKVNANTANAATITNSITAASATTDPTPGNNTATATTTVNTRADLAVTKTDSPDPVSAGGNLTYTITYVNNGASDAQTVTLTDAVPANTTFVSATVTTGTGWSTAAPSVGGTGNVVFSKGTSPVGETATFTIVVKVNSNVASGSTITNVVTAASATTDPTPGNNTATATTTTNTMADISVTKTDSPDPVVATQNLTYTITLTNNGASDAQTVTVTDALPANTTFVSATAPKGWTTSAPAVGGTGNVVFSKATVTAGEVAVFTIVVNVNGSTPNNTVITNSATGATATTDPNPGNNTGTTTTTVIAQADLAVTKSDSPDPVCVGDNITYTIGLINNGPGPGLSTTVTDATPANTTFVSATVTTGTGWSTSAPAVGGTGNIVFSKANVANGETAAFTIVVKVNNGTVHHTVITNTVTAASTIPDPTPGNNSAMAQTTVDPIAPTITCPANVIAAIPGTGTCAVVNYPAPTVTDNCSGATVVCTPPSGTCFPVGTTTVTCTATDSAGNTAMCSFSVTVYDICLQDDANPGTVILINSTTGDYRFCCNGTTYTGTGTIKVKGATTTLEHFTTTRRVSAKVDKSTFSGTGYIQQPPGSNLCTITDRDIRNNTCTCQ